MNPWETAKRVYFVGIKGVGMSALAIWANETGKVVAGSDASGEFPTDEALKKAAVTVHEGFDGEHLWRFHPDLVIYTGAHGGAQNPQVAQAKAAGIVALPHGKALGDAMAGKRQISVAGSHGKTTTSAMIATVLTYAGLDPSYAIGCGSIRGLGAAGHAGKGEWFVAEADEYVTDPGHDATPRFLWQRPEVLVVTNIDFDHPDAYADLSAVQDAFVLLQKQQVGRKITIINADDPASSVLHRGRRIGVFRGELPFPVALQVPGQHNVYNAAATAAACAALGIEREVIKRGLEAFGGTKRRLERLGEAGGAFVYDDYAHHPREIEATVAAVREMHPNRRVVIVFQPHTFSRTKALMEGFRAALQKADVAIVTDVYPSARETNQEEGLSRLLGGYYAPTRDAVTAALRRIIRAGDVVLFMGAGDINQWAGSIL